MSTTARSKPVFQEVDGTVILLLKNIKEWVFPGFCMNAFERERERGRGKKGLVVKNIKPSLGFFKIEFYVESSWKKNYKVPLKQFQFERKIRVLSKGISLLREEVWKEQIIQKFLISISLGFLYAVAANNYHSEKGRGCFEANLKIPLDKGSDKFNFLHLNANLFLL